MSPKMKRPVRYHLRVPTTPEHFDREIRALDHVIALGRIDEVMFFVPHAEERSPGQGTLEEVRNSVERLRPVFERYRAAGVAVSINLWWTASFSHFPTLPRVQDDQFPFRWAVTPEGKLSRVAACPECPRWRAHIREVYAAYAELKPARIWIDDDVHTTLRADMHAPCFCDACLKEMTRRTGRVFDRAGLLAAIMKDPPNPVRREWLDMQELAMKGIVRDLTGAVHGVSPDTKICLMHSPFEYHGSEGREWGELVQSLGQPRPTLRPSIGPYIETTAPGIAEGLNGTRLMQAVLKDSVDIAPEIENYPHSRFGKSAAIVKLDLQMAQLFGIPEMTFSIFRFGGRLDLEFARSRYWPELLARMKPRLQALANLGIVQPQQNGVSLYYHEKAAHQATGVEGLSRPAFLARKRPWDAVLPSLGFAVRFGWGPVTAYSGEAIAAMSEKERDEAFRWGMLLDGRAAETVVRMGLGERIGIRGRKADAGHSHETIEDEGFGELAGDVMNTRWEGPARQFDWLPGAKPISALRGYRGERTGDGVVLFENTLGGRVAVFPFDGQAGTQMGLGYGAEPYQSPSFLCAPRQAQLRDVLRWLYRGPVPLAVRTDTPVYPLLVKQHDRLVVAVAPLSADGLDALEFDIAPFFPKIGSVSILDERGRWKKARMQIGEGGGGAGWRIQLGLKVNPLDVAVVMVTAATGGDHDGAAVG